MRDQVWDHCHEAVIRGGIEEPCDKTPVAMRLDERESPPSPYPVCARHARGPMVPLSQLLGRYEA